MRDTGMKWYRLGDLTNFENVEHGYGADTKKICTCIQINVHDIGMKQIREIQQLECGYN